jgi:hypothetical protein
MSPARQPAHGHFAALRAVRVAFTRAKGAGVAIAALVVWVLTAAAGVYLLPSVIAAERAGASPPAAPTATGAGAAPATTPVTSAAGMPAPVTGRAGPHQAGAGGTPPPVRRTPTPIPRVKASVPPGEHPLLQFCHPALGIIGLACWFGFVATHDRAFAWIAVAVLAVTIGAGLGWLATHARFARHHAGGGPRATVPAHRVVLHGLAAAATCGLAVIAVLAANHG